MISVIDGVNERVLRIMLLKNGKEIRIKLRSFKSSEHINEKGDGPFRGFGYLSLLSDPIDLATWNKSELLQFCIFQQGSRYKD